MVSRSLLRLDGLYDPDAGLTQFALDWSKFGRLEATLGVDEGKSC